MPLGIILQIVSAEINEQCWTVGIGTFFFFGGLLENWTYVFIKYNKADSFAPSPVIC